MTNYLAQAPINLGPSGGFRGFGPLGLVNASGRESPFVFTKVISTTIGVMTTVAFIWFIIQFFIGAVGIIFSGGDKGKLEQARSKIGSALIGVVIVVVATFLIDLFGSLMGIDILDLPGQINILSQ